MDGLPRLAASHVDRQQLIPPPGKGHEPQLHAALVHFAHEKALVPQLVKAPALGTAGIGVGRPLRRQHTGAGVDMAQRQIVQTAAGDLLHADRPVAAVLCACFAMQHADGHALLSGGDPLQRRAL